MRFRGVLAAASALSTSPAAAPAVPGTAATVFPTSPAVHFHFDSQTVSADGDGRLTLCPDLRGLADLVAASTATAPKLMTDGLGRQFLRFNGSEAAAIANSLVLPSNRSWMALMVGRVHHQSGNVQLLNPRFASYTSPTSNTQANASVNFIKAIATSNAPAYLQAGSPAATTNAADCYKVIPGCQMQVMATASRDTAGGGTRIYVNNDKCDVAQGFSASNYVGGIVGGIAGASNTENITTGANDVFDCYEIAIWTTGPNNTDADAIAAAAVSNYAITQLDTNLVLEGDSITYGAPTSLPVSPARAGGLGSRLTGPGGELVPANVRVVNLAMSGNTAATLLTRRDATNSMFDRGKYPGGAAKNRVVIQIGRNDMAATAGTAAAHYANVAALLNTTTTGYLQRGWSVTLAGNIASSDVPIAGSPSDGPITLQGRIEAFRGLTFTGTAANATFLGDVLAGSGQTFDGLVSVLPLHEITVSGDTKFKTSTDAGDTASGYYDSDSTHPRLAGVDLMVSGGDTPAYGYGAIL